MQANSTSRQIFKPAGPILEVLDLPRETRKSACVSSKATQPATVFLVFQPYDARKQRTTAQIQKERETREGTGDTLDQIFMSLEQAKLNIQQIQAMFEGKNFQDKQLAGEHRSFSRVLSYSMMLQVPVLLGLMVAQYLRLKSLLSERYVI